MDEAALICAKLLRTGSLERSSVPSLDFPDVRADVGRRLAAVGLELATSAFSEHVGVRLSSEVTSDPAFDAASNLGLRADACALLVVIWAKLVLPKRTATETREVPGQALLLPDDQAQAARQYAPEIRVATLVREFGSIIGSKSHIERLLTQLRRLGFVKTLPGKRITAGPLMELGVDGERMIAFIRRKVLAEALKRAPQVAEEEPDLETQVMRTLRELGGTARMSELAKATGEKPERLRPVLRELIEGELVRKEGERTETRYVLMED